jgi:hypothetical protein
MILNIPLSLRSEHKELHQTIAEVANLPGKTGTIAKKIAKLLHPHFLKEEEFALPPLGLLPGLAKGYVTPQMKSVLKLTSKMKAEYQSMLAEHIEIVSALLELSEAARKENHSEVTSFVERLMQHAKTEEEVLYPMSIVIGDYIRLKLSKSKARQKIAI